MILMNYKTNIYKYFIYISILLVTMFVITKILYTNENTKDFNSVTKSTITFQNENTNINVDYPRFQSDKINTAITDYLYGYIKDFKSYDNIQKVLDMSYELYYFDDYVNIVFNIENSISEVKKSNILINLKEEKLGYITAVFEKDYLVDEINNLAYYKYSTDIYDVIKKSNVNNHTYVISQDKVDVYFDELSFFEINYIPFVTIVLNVDTFEYEEENKLEESKKYISFTFDDGPSEYTEDFLRALELNNSSATFFMLGNKMKYNKDIVNLVEGSNSEVGSHTYSHKYLTSLTKKEMLDEINSATIVYNDITGNTIKYIRPPYGSYNDTVIETIAYPLILWNIDPKDWLVRNSTSIYNSVLKSACDGCIVLMHDSYKESLEAVKMLLPKLKEMGYEVVSISKLAEIKDKQLSAGDVIRNIK